MPTGPSRFVDNGGVRLHYLDSGPDPGLDSGTDATDAPIVFVPGMSCVAEDYLAMLPVFGRRCIVVDLRGHGRSDAPPSGYTLDDKAGDIARVVDAVTDGPIHLMTFSRGTCYALAWARDHPERVLSVAIGDYPAREIELPPEVADTFLSGRWRGTPVTERVEEHAVRCTFADATSRSLWGELAALDVPLLVVRSTADVPMTDDDWLRYAADFPNAELVEFDDSPHDIFRPDRERYPDLVRAHVDRVDR